MRINFVRYNKIYFIFGAILTLGSVACLIVFKLNPGIDFTGGSVLEIAYQNERPAVPQVEEKLADLNLSSLTVQSSGEQGIIIRMKYIDEQTHQEIIKRLGSDQPIEEKRFESIGATIGQELKQKTITLIIVSLFAIVLYIALAFRRVQRPIRSWQYGIASLLTLFHDIIIPLGVFAVLGKYYGVQITVPIIAALLTILGYSINNTVVVFDRIRENLAKKFGNTFGETVNESINQTLTRCLNTSLTTLLPLLAIFFWGGDTLKYFTLTLIIGIIAGLYSSIFLASPMLVSWLSSRKG